MLPLMLVKKDMTDDALMLSLIHVMTVLVRSVRRSESILSGILVVIQFLNVDS